MDDVKNNNRYQILTDSGWSDFAGVQKKGIQSTIKIKTKQNQIICTPDHKIYTEAMIPIEAELLTTDHKIILTDGTESVMFLEDDEDQEVYDIIGVDKNHRFYANNLLVSNCEFLIFDETLISPIHLKEMKSVEPKQRTGQVRWFEDLHPDRIYTVALDPSIGSGGDPAAIEVFEANTTTQVAEWKHNKTAIPGQIRVMAEIIEEIAEVVDDPNNIYYSIENNTIGEAALISLAEYGEENIRGTMLNEPRRPGAGRLYRKGFNTTNKTKLAACAKLKQLIESNRMKISSKSLISEFKNFVAKGPSYAAKPGDTDDLVMATLLTVRMLQVLKDYHKELTGQMRDYTDEIVEPMPFIAIF